jgi:transcription initiation factor IIE alpha subunit
MQTPKLFKSAVNSDIVCNIELKDNEYIHQIKFGYPRNQGKHSHSRWHFAAKNTNRVCLRFKCLTLRTSKQSLKYFRNNSELKRHIISSHSNRPYACPHCPHRSKTREKLDRHVFACHLAKANANYTCPHCHQKFAFKNSMKKHLFKGRCEVMKSQVSTLWNLFPCR